MKKFEKYKSKNYKKSGNMQQRNTSSAKKHVITSSTAWFKQIPSKEKSKFIKFDIVDF